MSGGRDNDKGVGKGLFAAGFLLFGLFIIMNAMHAYCEMAPAGMVKNNKLGGWECPDPKYFR